MKDPNGAADARRQLAELRANDPRFPAMDARLNAIAAGEAAKDNAERLELAERGYDTNRFALAARLWSEALETDPKIGDDRRTQHRYNAACSALLATTGKDKDDPKPDDAARAKHRGQAMNWLRAELSEWKKLALTAEPGKKEFIVATLKHWMSDPDLASVREATLLAKLPEGERAEWTKLWADVDRELKKAQ